MKSNSYRQTLFLLASFTSSAFAFIACGDNASTSSSSGSSSGDPVEDSGTSSDAGTKADASKDSGVTGVDSQIGGQVSGLFEVSAGDGGADAGVPAPVLVLQNNGKDDLTITKNGAFSFPTKTAAYAVTVKTQPVGHTCTVTAGSGTATGTVTNVQVTCARAEFVVTADVTGLKGAGLVLQNNGKDDLAITAPGQKPFATKVKFGDAYSVTVKTAPTHPTQACTPALGGIATGNVTVAVACVDDVFPMATVAESKTFSQAAGQLDLYTVSLAFDGTKYWVGSGDGSQSTFTTSKTLASYSVAGAFDTSYTTSGNPLSLFSVGGKGNTVYAYGTNETNKVKVKDNAGGLTDFATLTTPFPGITWPVLNQAGTEILTNVNGSIQRRKLDGTDLTAITLTGYGSEPGEGDWYAFHVVDASGYFLTLADGGKLTAWNPATGARVKSTQLANWDVNWSFQAGISFSYANGMVWVFDGADDPNPVGKWHGYDVGL